MAMPVDPSAGHEPADSALAERMAGWFVRVVALVVTGGGVLAAGTGVAVGAPAAVVAGLLVAVGGAALLRWSWRRRSSERTATHGQAPEHPSA